MQRENSRTGARAINSSFIVLLVTAWVAQLAIDFSTENIASTCIAFSASMLVMLYLRWTDALTTHPLSSFALFGFCVAAQMGALIWQSFSWAPFTYELRQPLATFGFLAIYQAVAIAAHAFYRSMAALQFGDHSPVRKLLTKSGLYATPTAANLWIIGVVGLFGILTGGGENGSKVSHGLSFLAWAPFLIPVYVRQQGPDYCRTKIHYAYLAGYVMLIVLLGIAANTRSMMFSGVVTLGLIALLAGMRNKQAVTTAQITRVAGVAALGVALIVPLADLATAMVVARSARGTLSASEMVSKTFNVLQQPHLIEAQRMREKYASFRGRYDENYIANPIVARFVGTKFHDNALYFASLLSPRAKEELADLTLDNLWATLPGPVLKFLKIPVNKEEMRFSFGDVLYHLSVGGALGGYKMGSVFGHGNGLFGTAFPLVYFGICLILFPILDLLTSKSSAGKALLSVVGMLTIWRLFLWGLNADSINAMLGFIVRAFPQSIFLYLIVFHISRLLVRIWPRLSVNRRPTTSAINAMP